MKQQRKQNIRNSNTWHCLACEKQMEHKEFIEHAKTVHHIDTSKGGTRQMKCHMDGADWFSSEYEWAIGGLKFIQSVVCKRAKDDMMRYQY